MKVLVGGVGQLFQGDLDLGRRAADRLRGENLGDDVSVEELHYGAVAVAQQLEDVKPGMLLLVGAERRGDSPGTVRRRHVGSADVDTAMAQGAVADAITGYVAIDLVVEVAAAFGALPRRTVAIEVEPEATEPSEQLSEAAAEGLEQALRLVRTEARRASVFGLADQLRDALRENRLERGPAVHAVESVLDGLDTLEREGRWANTFADRDRLRMRIAAGETGEGMEGRDWALWWSLIEELDRLQRLEAVEGLGV